MSKALLHNLYELGKYDETILTYTSALEKNEIDYNAWKMLAIVLSQKQFYSQAIECYDKALEIDPNYADAWNGKGNVLSNLEEFDEAIKCYDKALELNPNYADAWNGKGNVFSNKKMFDEAIKCYDKAIEIDPMYVFAWNNKGIPLENKGKYEEAIKCYDKAIEIDPLYVIAWNNKGLALSKLGRYEEAINFYDKAIEIAPKNADSWYNKAKALSELAKYEEAIKCYDKAIEIDPLYVIAWNNKGLALSKLGRYEEAINYYDKAIEIAPDNVSGLYNKGNALKSLGKYDAALESYNKTLKIDPTNVDARNNTGDIFFSQKKYADAEECYKHTVDLDKTNVHALEQLHIIYSNYTNQSDKALQIAQELLAIDSQSSETKTLVAADLIKIGKYKEGRGSALDALEKTRLKNVESRLILRFLIISSYLLDGNLSNGEKEINKFLTYYKSLEDIYFNVEEKQLDFKGFKNLVDSSRVDSKTKSTLKDLINLLQGETDRNRIGILARMASTFAETNVKNRRRLKIILPIAVVAVIASFSAGFILTHNPLCPLDKVPIIMLSLEGFAKSVDDVAVDTNKHSAYVVSQDSDRTSVVDTCTNDVSQLPTGRGKAVAVNPTTDTVYIANADSKNVYDTKKGKIEAGLVSYKEYGGVKNIELPLFGEVSYVEQESRDLKNITVPSIPTDIAIDPKSNTIFVANSDANSDANSKNTSRYNIISVIDGKTNKIVQNISVYDNGNNTNDVHQTIPVYNNATTTNTIEGNNRYPRTSGVAITDIDIDTDQGILYAAARDSSKIFAIVKDEAENVYKEVSVINLGDKLAPWSISVDSNTGKLYVANRDSNTVQVANVRDKIIKQKEAAFNNKNSGIDNHFIDLTDPVIVPVGLHPVNVLADPKTNMIFVSNQDSDNISIIDANTHSIKTIQVGQGPNNVALDDRSNKVYVVSEQDILHPVMAIDADNIDEISSIQVGHHPTGITVDSAKHMIYVANYIDGTVSVLNGSTKATGEPIQVGKDKGPTGISFDPKTKMVYVTNYLNDTVSVINSSTRKVIGEPIQVGKGPTGISFDPTTHNHNLYITNTLNGTVSVINSSTRKVIGEPIQVGKGPTGISFDPKTKMVYVANFDGDSVSVIDSKTNNKIETLKVGKGPNSIAIDNNTHDVYVTNLRSNTISVVKNSESKPNMTEMRIKVRSNISSPTCTSLKPSAITAYADGPSSPTNAIDNNNDTNWSDPGIVSWIQADLGSTQAICSIDIFSVSQSSLKTFDPRTISISASNETAPKYSTKMFNNTANLVDLTNSLATAHQDLELKKKMSNELNVKSNGSKPVQTKNTSEKPTKIVETKNIIPENYKPIKNKPYISARYVRITVNGTSVGTGIGHIEELGNYTGTNPVTEISFNRSSSSDRVLAWPMGILFDNNMIFVGGEKYNWVSLIDLKTHNLQPIPVGRSPTGIAFDSSKNMIYVTNRDSDTVSIINGTTKSSFPVESKHP
jgi:YVTN family beta-propeller protein